MSLQATETTQSFDVLDKSFVVSDVLAELLLVNRRTIQRFATENDMPRESKNRFHTVSCVRWYIEHISAKSGSSDKSIIEERRLLIRTQRLRHELEIARRRGELIDADSVGQVLNQMAVIFSTQLEGLGARMAAELAATTDPVDIQRALQDECRAIRTATSAGALDLAVHINDSGDTKPAASRKRGRVGRSRKDAAA